VYHETYLAPSLALLEGLEATVAAMSNRHGSRLLLTLDAFGTIFTPREPVVKQYLDVAQRLGLASLDESLLQDSFRTCGLLPFMPQRLR
jgi:hypothetical protein